MLASLLHISQRHSHSHSHTHAHSHSHAPVPTPTSTPAPAPAPKPLSSGIKDAVEIQITPLDEEMPLHRNTQTTTTPMKDFLAEVKGLFEAAIQTKRLHAMSRQLQKEFRQKLKASNMCMLPSFHHTLPTGREKATILALDVGGSTFRIALIELSGGEASKGSVKDDGMEIKRLKSFPIDNSVRSLEGRLFFDWVAERIDQVLDADNHQADNKADGPLPMALAWSFPIEQTSTRSGKLLAMGKGFLATVGVEGNDICELVTAACQKRNLNVSLQAIVNDSSATLLSQAYRDSSTRISLIMGTGINAAIYLPISALNREKFGSREQSWWDEANHVLVNTELSMFGKDVWDATRWDDDLNQKHQRPDFQPLEYKAGGRFLGELVRLVIVEGVEKGVLFGGHLPKGLDVPYALDTGLIGIIEGDQSSHLAIAVAAFTTAHPLSSPSARADLKEDIHCIRNVSAFVTTRAAAYVATAVHALWELQRDTSNALKEGVALSNATNDCHMTKSGIMENRVTIACNGSIMEKYPGFKRRCQAYLDELAVLSGQEYTQGENRGLAGVTIEMAAESSVFGAAVAAAAEEAL